jgi:SAM-dependent methyltransferase
MRDDYLQVFQSPQAVDKYDRTTYATGTYASRVDGRQRRWLRALLPHWFTRPPVQHDFACGTGRAIKMLAGLVRAAHGYDTSAEMLHRARERGVPATYHLLDPALAAAPDLRDGEPRLVTVFRFLLNVDDFARDLALDFAARTLGGDPSGLLVVENHGPTGTLRALGRRRHRHNAWFAELSDEDVTDMLTKHGFRVVARRGFAVLPPGAYRHRGLRTVAGLVDGVACHAPTAPVATNVLYVSRPAG